MHTAGIVVAAGYGSFRKNVCGEPVPKLLEKIRGQEMIVRVVGTIRSIGIKPIIVVLNPLFKAEMREVLDDYFPDLEYVIQPNRFGAADAVGRALPLLQAEGFNQSLITFGDMPMWSEQTITELLERHSKEKPPVGIMTTVPRLPSGPKIFDRYGRVITHQKGHILRAVEAVDATPEELAIRLVNPCLWIWNVLWLTRMIPDIVPKERGDGHPAEKYLPPLIQLAAQQGRWLSEYRLSEDRVQEALGVNTAEELLQVTKLLIPR